MLADSHRDTWRDAYGKSKLRKNNFERSSGEVKPLYGPGDSGNETDALGVEDLGYPGSYPFVRGIYPSMYRGRLWTMRQYAGFGTAEETNKRFHYLLEQGQTGLSTAFDLPTQMGYDSTDPLARDEAGKVGVAIDTVEDMDRLLQGLPLDRLSLSMTINSTAAILLCMVQALAAKRGITADKLRGTVQNDILKEYESRGTFIYRPEPSLRLVADLIEYASENIPKWNTISISGYHIREAGATAVQELAFTMANGVTYVQTVLDRGMDVDDFAPRLSFFFNAHNNLFEEVAKFRAARRMWARIMRERFGAENPDSWKLRFHAQTAGSALTAQQPLNNSVRVTLQALAAVLGGAQSLHTNSWDEALALPGEESVLLALRTQQILAEESGVADVIDPVGGSWMVERLTGELEEEAFSIIKRIDDLGGMVKALEVGYIQKEIHRSAYEAQKKLESGDQTVVGVNRYTMEESARPQPFRVREDILRDQESRIEDVRRRRSSEDATRSLDALSGVAEGKENVVPKIYDCVESLCTIGEISGRLRDVFGAYRDPGFL
jgi:methylmalonyl-CoA mutase N-terminal domain/subunit